ncbi:ADP-ribosylglycohydrolase family protein [Noviherbaspirillum pedocola]|uniref:ADP-ribosylglycohydrolase family protein n=1 Tax=Noviherbaspirillum pedocola TaxID=2801341 RepID=A0A934T3J5_9BURK|nr:ADP-ribosylglycohydrolase family protein [Noviherbaspirillum pedocola]MBK4738989.1 ADP-ribosylglycohydrolase family protein [Noviherbaspirillum pedocola]
MRENNWAYALDCTSSFGNDYAADRGESYLSYWEKGLSIKWDGSEMPQWREQLNLVARPAAQVAAELSISHSLPSEEEQLEASTQPAWRSKRQQRQTVQARFLGCLLGGAVGDTLGAPVEFMSRTEILRRFGPQGITQYAPAYGGLGTITDDTQMSLFTAEGLI